MSPRRRVNQGDLWRPPVGSEVGVLVNVLPTPQSLERRGMVRVRLGGKRLYSGRWTGGTIGYVHLDDITVPPTP